MVKKTTKIWGNSLSITMKAISFSTGRSTQYGGSNLPSEIAFTYWFRKPED